MYNQAKEKFIAQAVKENLIEIRLTTIDSPLGLLTALLSPIGILELAYPIREYDEIVLQAAKRWSPAIIETPLGFDQLKRQLEEYFTKQRTQFDLGLDLRIATEFSKNVLQATQTIPYGQVLSYNNIAKAAGNPKAARAAGSALGRNRLPIIIPCHRVLHSTGAITRYAGGVERKRYLLDLESSGIGSSTKNSM